MEKFKNINDIVPRIVEDYATGKLLAEMALTYISEGYREANGSPVSTSTLSKLAVKVGGCKGRNNTSNQSTSTPPVKQSVAPLLKEVKIVIDVNNKKVLKEVQDIAAFIYDSFKLNGYLVEDPRTAAVIAVALQCYGEQIKEVARKEGVIFTNSNKVRTSQYHK